MRKIDFPADIPQIELISANSSETLANGGSCIAGPDGAWLIEPVVGEEKLIVENLDHQQVRAERQNFDPAGHYARPDVTQLTINRQRQSTLKIIE
jgi:nitrilase